MQLYRSFPSGFDAKKAGCWTWSHLLCEKFSSNFDRFQSFWLTPFLKCTKPPHSFHLQPKKSPIVDCSCDGKNSVPDFLVEFSCYIEWMFNCHEEKKTIHFKWLIWCFGCVAVLYTIIIHNIRNTQSVFRWIESAFKKWNHFTINLNLRTLYLIVLYISTGIEIVGCV